MVTDGRGTALGGAITLLWAVLALQLGSSVGCFINNCPQGGKRSGASLEGRDLQLPADTGPVLTPGVPHEISPAAKERSQKQHEQKRFLVALSPRYRDIAGSEPNPPGTCFIQGVCSYPDCCSFEACVEATECRVLRKGYRILVEYIFSKLEDVGSQGLSGGVVA